MPNLLKFLTAVFTVQLVAFAATAKTYYFIGTAGSGSEDRIYTSKQGESAGWAESATATTAIGHTAANGNDYVIVQGAMARMDPGKAKNKDGVLPGDSLTIAGSLLLKSDNGETYHLPPVIGDGGTISGASNNHVNRIDANISIPEGRELSLNVSCSNDKTDEFRDIVIGVSGKSNAITGAGTLRLGGGGGNTSTVTSYIELAADMSGFSGAIAARTGDYAAGPRLFHVKISGAFGGSVEALPTNTKKVMVNYDGLPAETGLKVSSTTIPSGLKTALVLYSPTADWTVKNLPLMTFPAGMGLSLDEMAVKHAKQKDGAETAFADLGVVVNGDLTMTIVANFEGKVVQVNGWMVEPALTKSSWMVREDEPGELTPPAAKLGADSMTATLNGKPWDGTMPTAVGTYEVVWSVQETADYTGISVSRSFTITEYVDPATANVRYFSSDSPYWKKADSISAALSALPASGGIIEVNADFEQDVTEFNFTRGNVVLRSCSDPSKAGRKFTVKRGLTARTIVNSGCGLVISNLSYQVADVDRSAALFSVDGGTLTLGEDAEARVNSQGKNKGALVDMEAVAGKLCLSGAILTNSTTETPLIKLSGHAHAVDVLPGTAIVGNRTRGSNFGDKPLLADMVAGQTLNLRGGVCTNNVLGTGCCGFVRSAGAVKVSGSPIVRDNRKSDSSQANLVPTKASVVQLDGALASTASIGVRYGAKDEQFGTVTGQGVTTAMAHCFKSDLARKCFGRISGTDLLWQGPGLMMLLQ